MSPSAAVLRCRQTQLKRNGTQMLDISSLETWLWDAVQWVHGVGVADVRCG
jgi:hypothetical protein